ncbi:hypothetical protein ABZX77_50015 [Streptomyces sp. NPDC004237]|uniref:hypothetical protein n=1 Tax=Streptomyces sp. NPDC004237 TaxID=3154455 RepID=UPI0033BBB6B6
MGKSPYHQGPAGQGPLPGLPQHPHSGDLERPPGQGAGSAGAGAWTPFKEFNKSFEPDHAKNAIKLTPDFFKEVGDGRPATLTGSDK